MGDIKHIDAETIAAWFEAGDAVIIDVREPNEYAMAHVPGSIHLPMSGFQPSDLPEVEDGKYLVFMCASGQRSDAVASHLLHSGYLDNAINMVGGIQAWGAAGYALSR